MWDKDIEGGRSEIVIACLHVTRILQRKRAYTNNGKMQISNFENVLRKLVLLKCITDGGLGAGSPAAGGFGGLGGRPLAVGRFFVIFLINKLF